MSGIDDTRTFTPINIAVLTVSDTRTRADDTSGDVLQSRIEAAGHSVPAREILRDDIPAIQAQLKSWIADPNIDAVISTGGTGLTGRDVTPEAVTPLFDKVIDGFAFAFHRKSMENVGLSTMQSRACAGLADTTFIFCLPGSNGAVKDGWEVIGSQLDSRHRPCNFVELMPRLAEK
ncbi:molybdenum cofactor biosynthesis protein B [Litorimonas sp. RW-G-Af-16]|uniref:molybdenum cofactor biosynthesis protein B n=1 Tax=Litorimonas sp. RW-G-Af-16 TaxID=3241168 RepID=UPI003AAC7FD1